MIQYGDTIYIDGMNDRDMLTMLLSLYCMQLRLYQIRLMIQQHVNLFAFHPNTHEYLTRRPLPHLQPAVLVVNNVGVV